MTRVLLVTDCAACREPLVFLLRREDGVDTVAEASSLAEARALLAAGLRADVALVALALPDGDGAGLIARLCCAAAGGARVVALADRADPGERCRALAAGAAAVLTRCGPLAAILVAVRRLGRAQAAPPHSTAPQVGAAQLVRVS